jgi:hypothetical protein
MMLEITGINPRLLGEKEGLFVAPLLQQQESILSCREKN